MPFTNRRQSETLQISAQAEILPDYINGDALERYYQNLPNVVQRMSTDDLISRANDMFHDDGVLSTWERGTTDQRTGRDIHGALEVHAALYARGKGSGDKAEHDRLVNEGFYKFVLPYVEDRVQDTIRDTLRDRIFAASTSHEPDEVFKAFTDSLANYDPRDLERARQLSTDVFNRYTAMKTSRLAPIVPERTFAAFAAISQNSNRAECVVPGSGTGVRVTVNMAKVGMLQGALVQEVRAAGAYGRTPNLERIKQKYAPLYEQLGYEAPATQKTVVPTTTRLVVGVSRDSIKTLGRAGEAAARVTKDRVELTPQKMLNVTTVGVLGLSSLINVPTADAAPKVESSISLQVPEIQQLDLTGKIENVAASSALPAAFLEAAPTRAESQEAISNQALRTEINRLVKQSRESKGFWSKWETVDADVLYDAIIREEKRHPHSVVNRFLVLPQLKQESFLKINAVSSAKAKGLTQFMPGTWKTWGHGKSPYDPNAAVRAQFEYDIALYNQAKERFPHMNETQLTRLMLAGYNAGPNNSYVKNGNVPPSSFAHGQTYNYVKIITKGMASMKDRLPGISGHATAPKATVPKVVAKAKELFTPSASLFGMLNDTVAEGDFSPIQLGGPAETGESDLSPALINTMLGRLSVETSVDHESATNVDAPVIETPQISTPSVDGSNLASSAVPAAFLASFNSNPDVIDEAAPAAEALDAATPAAIPTPQISTPSEVVKPENRDPANTPLNEGGTPTDVAPVQPSLETPPVATPEVAPAPDTPRPTAADLMQAFAAVGQKVETPQVAPISIDLTTPANTSPEVVDIPLETPAPVEKDSVQDILPPAITAPAPVETPKPAEKLAPIPPAQPKAAEKKAEANDRGAVRKAEVQRLKSSGNFKGSQAISDKSSKAPRTPLEDVMKSRGEHNGKLDGSDLVRVGDHWGDAKLHPVAAASFRDLDAAFYKKFGHHIKFNGSISDYRSFGQQEEVHATARPGFAATPGGSNHGWGLAGDLTLSSKEFKWMKNNAINFGWVHPEFARDGGPTPERWHWECWVESW